MVICTLFWASEPAGRFWRTAAVSAALPGKAKSSTLTEPLSGGASLTQICPSVSPTSPAACVDTFFAPGGERLF